MITYAKLPYHHNNHDQSRRRRTNRRGGEKRKKIAFVCSLSRSSHHSQIFATLLLLSLISLPSPPVDFPRRSPEESTSSHRLTCIDTRHATRKRSGQRLIKLIVRHAHTIAARLILSLFARHEKSNNNVPQ